MLKGCNRCRFRSIRHISVRQTSMGLYKYLAGAHDLYCRELSIKNWALPDTQPTINSIAIRNIIRPMYTYKGFRSKSITRKRWWTD